MKEIKKIIVVFKTHLDIGFTDFAENVLDNYINSFIPKAIENANLLNDSDDKFIWTTGSWLIYEYLLRVDDDKKQAMSDAINKGYICWHALPFTTHSEDMDADEYRKGLSLSKELDAHFGKQTIAGKYTDVPGHTRGIVPILHDEGIKFLHVGVNSASTAPTVPETFIWKDEKSNKDIVVMYNAGGYGKYTVIPSSDVAIYFAHTNDNLGPQSPEEVRKMYAQLKEEYPNATVVAGTLDDVADEVLKVKNTLPVITSEIGDSWIHGVATDPKKSSQYRALLRFRKELDKEEKDIIEHGLLCVAEHTRGLDEKTHLHDHDHFTKDEFNKLRLTANGQKMEQSWAEQRAYVTNAINGLSASSKQKAIEFMSEYKIEKPCLCDYAKIDDITSLIKMGESEIQFNSDGEICHLKHCGKTIADKDHKIGKFLYEVFSKTEVGRFGDQYMIEKFDWAIEDFGKIGCENAIQHYMCSDTILKSVHIKDNTVVVEIGTDANLCEKYGCPRSVMYFVTFNSDTISFDLAYWDKDASRVPEGMWFSFNPIANNLLLDKMGSLIDPTDVIHNGSVHLHAVDSGVKYDELDIDSLDCQLVGINERCLFDFNNRQPNDGSIHFNLYNNMWGTNFPMWYDDNARFRFEIKLK